MFCCFFKKMCSPFGRNVPLRGMCCCAECVRAHQPKLHIGAKRPHCTKCITLREAYHIKNFCNFAKIFQNGIFKGRFGIRADSQQKIR